MKAKRENKVYTINTEQEKARYLKEGYDIYNDEGVLLEHSPLKKIAYEQYAKLEAENKALKAEIEQLNELNAELKGIVDLMKETAEPDTDKPKKVNKKAGE